MNGRIVQKKSNFFDSVFQKQHLTFSLAVMDNKLALALKHLGLLSCAITIGCPLPSSSSEEHMAQEVLLSSSIRSECF
ncbi:hypothetical protein RO3G_02409 [Rhizopus delemar RA 99-880]|uniref:Uncharacterized protein n=1 Tax=Rhizopus delemar (strain RA 99-880 / ATCC MYA-4621 / FGSC 9543 / NRRL 43880) TaxID=246409 RepID=I1BNC5_RHIO9|nr:hypothetical protein RO3G_02409 [Rhizopus delemar RA 99-880]|eukprot:EIE77705.1 hypothetical protein RO3G_02409 [Rhizopus delemar RA 99-880]